VLLCSTRRFGSGLVTMLAPPPSFSQDSIGDIAEQVVQFSYYRKQIAKNQHVKRKVEINLSDLLNMEVLDEIRQVFLKNQDENGQESLLADEFIEVLSRYLPRPDIERLYQKIDVNDDGHVDWQEFTGFLTTSSSSVVGTTKMYNKIFTLKLEQPFDDSNHKELIDFICFSSKPIPVLATAGRDGQILIWNQSDLRRIGAIVHHDKNEVFLSNLMAKLTIQQKAMVAKSSTVNPITLGKKNVLITSLTMMPLSGHVCVSSGDCCVSLYDLSAQEICGRITTLTHIPTTLEAFAIVDKIKEVCHQYLVIGDAKGKIFLLQFDAEFGMSVDAGSKKKNQILMAEAVQRMESAVPHRDWISSMVFVPDLSRLVIASMDGTVSLFNNQSMAVDRVFHGHKVGVRCVAWCNSNKFLLSAGTDRAILIWDPYTLRINMTIDGLTAMIVTLTVNDRLFEIIAVLEDKTIRTWDAVTFEPIATVIDNSFQLPTNLLSAALFVPSLNSLYTAGSRLSCWQPDRPTETLVDSNDDDLLSVIYNPVFFLILIITRSGVVTTFHLSDGSIIIKFTVVDSTRVPVVQKIDEKSGQILPYVTHAVFDFSYRRLIIITKECSEIQIWNFHNGQCLKVLRPRLPSSLFPASATTYVTGQLNPRPYSLTTLTYQHIYYGPLRLPKKYLVFGTDVGVTSCLIETGDEIEEESAYNLVLPERSGKRVDPLHAVDSKTPKAVDWIIPSSENKVLVRYRNFDVVQWDLEKSIAGIELCRRANDVGESFVALRRRGVARSSKHQAAPAEKLSSTLVNGSSEKDKDGGGGGGLSVLEEIDSDSRPESPDDSETIQTPTLSLPPASQITYRKANGKRALTVTQPAPPAAFSAPFPRGTMGRPSVSLKQSRLIRPSLAQNNYMVGEESIMRTPVAPAAVVGVARSTFRRPTLNPLEGSIDSSMSDFTASQSLVQTSQRLSRHSRVSILHPARPADSARLTEASTLLGLSISESTTLEEAEERNEDAESVESPRMTKNPSTTSVSSSIRSLHLSQRPSHRISPSC
jgi:WD40 repeat protein